MADQQPSVSKAFGAFMQETPQHAQAWLACAKQLEQACALDAKTRALAYLAVLAALRMESGVPFHVAQAVAAGASRQEILSAILVGLPAAGHGVTQVLPAALAALEGV